MFVERLIASILTTYYGRKGCFLLVIVNVLLKRIIVDRLVGIYATDK